jgi:hypothetical protein
MYRHLGMFVLADSLVNYLLCICPSRIFPQVPFIFTDFHPIIGAIARRQVELTDIDLHMSLNLMPEEATCRL